MKNLIAKRYARALSLRSDVGEIYENLHFLSSAFAIPKFESIVKSSQVDKEKKIELINSFFEKTSVSFQNLIKILIKNSRLECIPYITKELEKERSFKENTFLGVVHSKEILAQNELSEFEKKLSKKFGVNVKLKAVKSEDDSVKIELEELGYELSFSMKALQNKLNEYILKII